MKSNKKNKSSTINIGVPIYENVDSLDVTGAFQVFHMLGGGINPYPFLITETGRPVTSFEGIVLGPKYSFKTCPRIDVLFIPGAAGYTEGLPVAQSSPFIKNGVHNILANSIHKKNPYLDFIYKKGQEATWVTGVCTGAILMAAAGLLKGHRVTTHWAFKGVLAMFPDLIVADGFPRYVIDDQVVTGGGISSAIDCGLAIGTLISGVQAAKNAQLAMQYSPDPPYNDGDPSQADILTIAAGTANVAGIVKSTAKVVEEFLKNN